MKRLILALALLLVALPAAAQTSFYTGQATQAVNIVGSPQPTLGPIPFAGVRVCNLPLTQSAPCLPLATVTDANGNTLSNSIGSNFGQFQSDNFGRFTFGCVPGANLQLQYTGASNTPQGNLPITCPSGLGVGTNLIINSFTAGNGNAFAPVTFSNHNNLFWAGPGATPTIDQAVAQCTSLSIPCFVEISPGYTGPESVNLIDPNSAGIPFYSGANNVTVVDRRAITSGNGKNYNVLYGGRTAGELTRVGIVNGACNSPTDSCSSGFNLNFVTGTMPSNGGEQLGNTASVLPYGTVNFKNGTSFSISAASEASNTVTITTTATCNFTTGQLVYITGVGVSGYNNSIASPSWTVLTPGCNGGSTFTYTNPTSALGASSGGTATAMSATVIAAQDSEANVFIAGQDIVSIPFIFGMTAAVNSNRSFANATVTTEADYFANNIVKSNGSTSTWRNAYGFMAANQGSATTENFGFYNQGNWLTDNETQFHARDASGVTHPMFYFRNSNTIDITPLSNAGGWIFKTLNSASTIFTINSTSVSSNIALLGTGTVGATSSGGAFLGGSGTEFAGILFKETGAVSGVAGDTVCGGVTATHTLNCSYNNDGTAGAGFPVSRTIASGTSTLTSNAALGSATCQAAITTAATGVTTTDSIEWSFATAPATGDAISPVASYVTANNVNFTRCNPTAAAQNVTAIVINWRVVR